MKKLRIAVLLVTVISLLGLVLACPSGSSGSVTTPDLTPVAGDFDITIASPQTIGSIETDVTKVVKITPKTDKSDGAITRYFTEEGTTTPSKTVPAARGTFIVTFDVAAVPGKWTEALGLYAGTLRVRSATDPEGKPVADDFTFSNNFTQNENNVTAVTVTPKPNKSQGQRAVSYTGVGGTTYAKSATVPQDAGTYSVTFDVAATTTWEAATGLYAGVLNVLPTGPGAEKKTPRVADFDITGIGAFFYNGNNRTVTVSWKSDVPQTGTPPAITVKYNDDETIVPKDAADYIVTFTVASTDEWHGVTLDAGILKISAAVPVEADYDVDAATPLEQFADEVIGVKVIAKANKSPGATTIYYQNTSAGNPLTSLDDLKKAGPGVYTVYFSVAASAPNWDKADKLLAGTLVIKNAASGMVVTMINLGDSRPAGEGGGTYGGSNLAFDWAKRNDPNTYQTVQLPTTGSKEIKPSVVVKLGLRTLTASSTYAAADGDYRVKYEKNAEVSNWDTNTFATIIVEGLVGDNIAGKTVMAYFSIGQKAGPLVYKWADDNDNLIKPEYAINTASGKYELNKGQELLVTNTSDSSMYEVVEWRLNGVKLDNPDTSSYTFKGTNKGDHYLTLVVKNTATGKVQNTTIPIRVI